MNIFVLGTFISWDILVRGHFGLGTFCYGDILVGVHFGGDIIEGTLCP